MKKTKDISERGKDYTLHQVELWDYQGVKGRCCSESEFQGSEASVSDSERITGTETAKAPFNFIIQTTMIEIKK